MNCTASDTHANQGGLVSVYDPGTYDPAQFRGAERVTVSGHDALSLLDTCPTGLVFVPSVGGIAHNENEDTHSDDLDTGMTVLLRVATRLCQSSGDPVAAARGA